MEIEIDGEKIQAELADSFLKKARGLAFRTEGKMLFTFARDTRSGIDMMLVRKPLHLYFMNSEKKVIDIQKAVPWTADPRTWKIYSPGKSYRYLLESFEELDVEEGQQLKFKA